MKFAVLVGKVVYLFLWCLALVLYLTIVLIASPFLGLEKIFLAVKKRIKRAA